MSHRTSLVHRAWLALLVALGLVLTGLAPAHADTAAISGRVEVPVATEHLRYWFVTYHRYDEARGEWRRVGIVSVAQDGTFSIPTPDLDGRYRLELDTRAPFADGYYERSTGYAPTFDQASEVRSGTGAIVVKPLVGATLSGTVTFQPGVPLPFRTNFTAYREGETSAALAVSTSTEATEAVDGVLPFTVDRLYPGHPVVLGVHAQTSGATRELFVRGDRLTPHRSYATPLLPGARVSVKGYGELALPPVEQLAAPSVTGRAVVGQQLSVTTGSWSPSAAEVSVQWLRDGTAIPGATASRYTVTAADRGAALSVRVTATAPDHATTTRTLAAGRVPLDPAPRATAAPKVTGTARLGATLRASAGSWDRQGVSLRYQWLRAGRPITGATGERYTLARADVGTKISVRVTARLAGHAEGVATSKATKKVAKARPGVKVKLGKVTAGTRGKVTVTVKVATVARPTGKVTVTVGKKKATTRLTATRKGSVTVRLPKLAKGKHKVTVRFAPSGTTKKYATTAATSTTLRVR